MAGRMFRFVFLELGWRAVFTYSLASLAIEHVRTVKGYNRLGLVPQESCKLTLKKSVPRLEHCIALMPSSFKISYGLYKMVMTIQTTAWHASLNILCLDKEMNTTENPVFKG